MYNGFVSWTTLFNTNFLKKSITCWKLTSIVVLKTNMLLQCDEMKRLKKSTIQIDWMKYRCGAKGNIWTRQCLNHQVSISPQLTSGYGLQIVHLRQCHLQNSSNVDIEQLICHMKLGVPKYHPPFASFSAVLEPEQDLHPRPGVHIRNYARIQRDTVISSERKQNSEYTRETSILQVNSVSSHALDPISRDTVTFPPPQKLNYPCFRE